MVSMFGSSVVDHVFIGGVMVNMFASSVVDHVFIGGVMVNMFTHDLPHLRQTC
jgi:3-phosphoglycerate kinase